MGKKGNDFDTTIKGSGRFKKQSDRNNETGVLIDKKSGIMENSCFSWVYNHLAHAGTG